MQPRRHRSRILAALALVFAAATVYAGSSVEPITSTQRIGCIDVWGEARYVNYGYDHIVHLRSRCRTRVLCDVSTDVSPQRIRVNVPAGESVEVLTLRGSPAQGFTPIVRCGLPGQSKRPAAAVCAGRGGET